MITFLRQWSAPSNALLFLRMRLVRPFLNETGKILFPSWPTKPLNKINNFLPFSGFVKILFFFKIYSYYIVIKPGSWVRIQQLVIFFLKFPDGIICRDTLCHRLPLLPCQWRYTLKFLAVNKPSFSLKQTLQTISLCGFAKEDIGLLWYEIASKTSEGNLLLIFFFQIRYILNISSITYRFKTVKR